MKKIILTALIAFIGVTTATAQSFGVKAGYTSGTVKASGDDLETDLSTTESGFIVGIFGIFEASESIDIKPEILYTNIEETNFLQIPILGKFNVGESGFNVQAGPQFNFVLEDSQDGINNFSAGLTAGLGYDITEQFFIEGHYALQVTNSISDLPDDVDFTLRTNFLNLSVGYKF